MVYLGLGKSEKERERLLRKILVFIYQGWIVGGDACVWWRHDEEEIEPIYDTMICWWLVYKLPPHHWTGLNYVNWIMSRSVLAIKLSLFRLISSINYPQIIQFV